MLEDSSQRSPTTLKITWKAPTFIGGTSIIDYQVSIARSDQDFSDSPISVTDIKYLAEGLTTGVTYKFRIKARNSYGISD